MVATNAIDAYQKTNLATADPLSLVVLCYERAIRDLKEARSYHEHRMMDHVYEKIHHAQDIVTELHLALDFERGGEIAFNLYRLYGFILRELIGINSQKDVQTYEHLISILSELKEAWTEIRRRHTREAVSLQRDQRGEAHRIASA